MTDSRARDGEAPLESWKAIAAYLNRDVRTAKRWEVSEGLPVHRHQHHSRSSVYAYASEIDAWRAGRKPDVKSMPPPARRGAMRRALAAAALITTSLATAGGGRVFGPAGVSAQDSSASIRTVWTGPDVDLSGRVSREGRFLSVGQGVNLAIRDLLTGAERQLTHDATKRVYAEYSIWSPDDARLAYAWRNANERYDLRVIDRTGGTPRVLHEMSEDGWMMPFDWSPDGDLIAVYIGGSRGTVLGLVSTRTATFRALKSFDWRHPDNMAFSPDGRFIAYDHAPADDGRTRDVFVIATDGSRESAAVEHPANDRLLDWHPDGHRLLFTSDRNGTSDVFSVSIRDGRTDGEARLVRRDVGDIWARMGFTAAGELLVGVRQTVSDVQLASLHPETRQLREPLSPLLGHFSGNRSGAAWSRDGKHLVFLSRLPFQTNLRVISIYSPASGETRTIRHNLSWFYPTAVWSPDGRDVFINGKDLNGEGGLHRVGIQTGQTERIRVADGGINASQPVAISPDGRFVFYIPMGLAPVLSRLEIATGVITKLVSATTRTLALSPDGRQIALVISATTPTPADEAKTRPTPNPPVAIAVVPVEGGEPRVLFTGNNIALTLAWTADGEHVVFAQRSGDIWRVPVAGGTAQALPLKVPGVFRLSAGPDGQLAISKVTTQQEVLALGNLD